MAAVDTGYGVLDYRLRMDERVEVMERTNALHAEPPAWWAGGAERAHGARFVSIDMSWTPQALAVPAAVRWLSSDTRSRIVSLVKPHYEATSPGYRERFASLVSRGALEQTDARAVLDAVLADLPALGVCVLGCERSPVTGKKSGRRAGRVGRAGSRVAANTEYLVLLACADGLSGVGSASPAAADG